MQIRPIAASESPGASRSAPSELTQLARDVVESGAKLEVPHKVAFSFNRYREAAPEEAVRHLDEPLRVRVPGLESPLPLQGEEDLRELAVFQNVRPASEVAQPERATALQQLAAQGWHFSGQDGEIGPYGAYNQLSQGVSAFKDERTVSLLNDEKLTGLARFYASEQPELGARLEEQGFRFFDASGRVGAAFELGSQAHVGRDGKPWFPVGDPGSLESRLEAFSRRLEEIPDLELAREFQQLVEQNQLSPEKAGQLLGDKSRRGLVANAIAREFSARSTADFCAAGLKICSYGNTEAQTAWLDQLAGRPDTEEVGKLASGVIRKLKTDNARYSVWCTALEAPTTDASEFGRRLYQKLSTSEDRGDLKLIGEALLQALPSTAGSQALRRWGSSPNLAARALVKGTRDLRQLAQEATEWNDKASQRLQLEELAADPRTAAVGKVCTSVFDRLQTDNARYYLWHEALQHADQPVPSFAKSLYKSLSTSENAADRKAIGQALLAGMEADPSTVSAVQAVRRWDSEPDTAARAVASKPNSSPCQLALSATAWNDKAAQLRQLQELEQDKATRQVGEVAVKAFAQAITDNARYYVWHAALEHPDEGLVAFCKALYSSFSTSENAADRKAIGTVLLDAMAADPATARGATAVRSWQSDPDTAARALAQKSERSLRDLALAATTWNDAAAQRRQLEELANDPATEKVARLCLTVFDQLKTDNSRYYLWHAAMESGNQKLPAFAKKLYSSYSTSENGADQKLIGQAILGALAADPDTARAAAAVQRWQSDPSTAARALAQKAQADPRELALTATAWNDRNAQKAQLEELARDPATATIGAFASKLYGQLGTDNSRYYVWHAAMEHGDQSLQKFAKSLYSSFSTSENAQDQRVVGQAIIEAMAADPATQEAAAAVKRWQSDPNTAARALASKSGLGTRQLALAATSWNDREAQSRQLEELAQTSAVGKLALDIFPRLQTENARYYVWHAALEKGDGKISEFGKNLYSSYSTSENASDRKLVGERLIQALEADPSTARAAGAVKRWQADPDTAARGLCHNPTASLRELALKVTTWNDFGAQRRQLDDLTGEASTLPVGRLACAMFNRVKTDNGRYYVWHHALEKADRPVAEYVTALFREGLGEDAAQVVQAYLDSLGQDASLKEIAALAREVVPRSGYSKPVLDGLFQALERHPATPPSLASQMARQRAHPDANQIQRLLAELDRLGQAEDEVRRLAKEMKATSEGISVQEDRVVVGGVVLRKEKDGPESSRLPPAGIPA